MAAMDGFNPYAPPSPASDTPLADSGTGEPVFTDGQVTGATFLGSPIAGFILLAINEKRMGRPERFNKMVGLGLLASIVVVTVAFAIPPEMPGFIVSLGYLLGMQQLARRWQGEEVMERLSRGTPKGSNWVVFGIAVACFVGMFLVGIGAYLAFPEFFEARLS